MPKPNFEIVPVIDIRHGKAVRAVAGDRANYQPLISPLCPDADPVSLAKGYRSLFPFNRLYVADLDGIEGRGQSEKVQSALAKSWTGEHVWIDDGRIAHQSLDPRITAIIGSETLLSAGACELLKFEMPTGAILSLDFKDGSFIGPSLLLEAPEEWPQRIIAMTLSRVGKSEGPDLAGLEFLSKRAGPTRHVYAAGGVRNFDDLKAIRDAGASGALVASALHSGQIKTGDLEEIAGWSLQN